MSVNETERGIGTENVRGSETGREIVNVRGIGTERRAALMELWSMRLSGDLVKLLNYLQKNYLIIILNFNFVF